MSELNDYAMAMLRNGFRVHIGGGWYLFKSYADRVADGDIEPLNEVCEHGCHMDKDYGFVVMAGCPVHD